MDVESGNERVMRTSVCLALREARRRSGLTQESAATYAGVSLSTLNRWEKTGSLPFVEAWKLAELYGCTVDALTGRESCRVRTLAHQDVWGSPSVFLKREG